MPSSRSPKRRMAPHPGVSAHGIRWNRSPIRSEMRKCSSGRRGNRSADEVVVENLIDRIRTRRRKVCRGKRRLVRGSLDGELVDLAEDLRRVIAERLALEDAGQLGPLVEDRALPARAALVGLVLPFEEMGDELDETAADLAAIAFRHVLEI